LIHRKNRCYLLIFLCHTLFTPILSAQRVADSSKILNPVQVIAEKKQNPFSSITPVQALDHQALQQINAETIAGAAKYFSGVLIKDYGGVGGLKTISVRSLGGQNTGLVYDGIPIADAQTGQVDLSKYSATFVQRLELDQANPPSMPVPARAYASASILAFTSNTFNTTNYSQTKYLVGMEAGSFGLWQPYAGIYLPVGKNMVVSANGMALWSAGNYPYTVDNGMFSEKTSRINSDIRAFEGELNTVNRFSDSSTLQTKIWGYQSERGLPGSIIYFNNISVQRLEDKNLFVQSRYLKNFGPSTTLLISGKYSTLYTKYTDPNFLNNEGGLDDRYTQEEMYGSAALSHRFGSDFQASFSSDIAFTHLSANISKFANPSRTSLWNNIAVQYAHEHWQLNASLLNTNISDQTKTGLAPSGINKFTPAFALGYKPEDSGPFLFRFFYKDIFRMPTFNDLYYNYITNINPKLLPEYSSQYDIGFTYSKNSSPACVQFSFSLDAYHNHVKDKIIAIPSENLFIWTMTNLGKVQIWGTDINGQAGGRFSGDMKWSVRIAYTWQQALDYTDPTSPKYKNEIPYTPHNSGSALAVLDYRTWSAGYSFLFSGNRYALGENDPTNLVAGWNTQDVYLAWTRGMGNFQTTVKGEVNNLFNQQYDVIQYYPMPGRSFKLSVIFSNL
jgi:vitamin B12 transporter